MTSANEQVQYSYGNIKITYCIPHVLGTISALLTNIPSTIAFAT